ncbi:MAG: PAS domain S-box protein, partial [Syntrophales bacterium]
KNIAQKDSNDAIGRIIVVDDEAELMSALCETLVRQGYETAGFLTGAEALAVLKEREFDLLLTDLMMPGMDGIELIRAGLEIDPNLIGIIMTGHGTVQTAVEAMKIGAFDYILKPFKLNTLLPLLSRAMQVRNLRLENMQLKETVAIHELGKAISFSSDLNSILNKIADTALQQCSADEVSIMLPTKSGRELYVAVVRGGCTENLGEHAPIEQGIAGWVARNRESVVFRGEVDDPRMAPIRPRNDIHTAVSMPMLSQSNLVGVLNVNITKSHRQFTLGQLKALSILVSIIAPILENTALYIQIRKAEADYRSIFENASEGIYQRTPDGRLISANPSFARVFGYNSPEDIMENVTDFVHQVCVDPDRGAEFARLIDTEGEVRNFEYQARRKDGSQVWISVNGHAVRDEHGVLLYYEGMSEDITECKRSEARLKLAKEILETLNRPNDIRKLINDILFLLKGHTGFEAIGIRLKEGEDYPYFVTNGFADPFLEAENYLCARDAAGEIIRDSEGHPYLEGKCGNILCGRTDPSLPFFTQDGSFWTNSTTKRLAEISANEPQVHKRNRCNSEGYESLALIPLRSGSEIIGLLHLSDSRQNLFTLDMIRFLEGIGASIGIGVARQQSMQVLRESEEKYRLHFENVTDVIFSIDSDFKLLSISPSVEKLLGYRPEELIGKPLHELQVLAVDHLEDAYSDIRHVLVGNDIPVKVCEFITKDGTRKFCEVCTTPLLHDGRAAAVISVARDITERKQAEEQLQDTLESLRRAVNTTIQVMVSAVETRDPYTSGHQTRTAYLARAIATDMGLPKDRIDGIGVACSIHDIGKLSIPAEILSKPTKLSEIEFELIKEHAQRGYEILKNVESPWSLAEIVYQHHERMDGSGYPRNLKRDDILMETRILIVADVVEAMASHRPYRPSLGLSAAMDEIEKNRGTLYDAAVVDTCLRLFREKGFKLDGT